jgi:hypothetical protein
VNEVSILEFCGHFEAQLREQRLDIEKYENPANNIESSFDH